MMNVEGYQNAVSGYYGNDVGRTKGAREGIRAGKASETGNVKEAPETKSAESKLSAKAQDFLKNLREANDDMDFYAVDSEGDAKDALSGSNKEFSVAFSAEEIEKMAADEDYANEKLNSVRHAMDVSRDITEQYNFDGKGITAKIGVSFGDDGKMQIFADLEKISEKAKERLEAAKEKRAEGHRPGERNDMAGKLNRYNKGRDDMVKRTTLTAEDEDDLIEQLQKLDWNAIKAEEPYGAGARFDSAV